MGNKRQHFVPTSYLKAWCDPNTPPGQTPYVWVHTADGSDKKRRAPENILSEADYYTFHKASGERDLFLERYLGSVESTFPALETQSERNLGFQKGKTWASSVFTQHSC